MSKYVIARAFPLTDLQVITKQVYNLLTAAGQRMQSLRRTLVTNRPHFLGLPLLVHFSSPIFVLVTLLVVIVEVVGHSSPPRPIIDPPANLLPGAHGSIPCAHDERAFCRITRNGMRIQVNYDPGAQGILSTFVETSDKTLADFILAWGIPTDYSRTDEAIMVSWDARAVQLAPHSFEPNSRVLFVAYGDVSQQTQPWRGFVNQLF